MKSISIMRRFDARTVGNGYPYIYTTINQETTVSYAAAAYDAVKAGLGMAGVATCDDTEHSRYGDWSYFGTLLARGKRYEKSALTRFIVLVLPLAKSLPKL